VSDGHAAVAAALTEYDIGGELGRGAWGIVLAGRHRHLRREVAIKRLPPAFAHDPQVRARFIGEARLLSSLDHPHIVPVYDYVERDDLCLLVMEQLPGGSVWDRFAERGIDTAGACAIGLVTAIALEHAHGRGVLHRDIKPENLLFGEDGALLKVADFGIAKVLTGERTMATVAGQVLGTPSYMAPEQARGEDATAATDVYALGSTLYRLLSGQLPFPPAASPIAALYQRVHQAPIELRRPAPHVPEALAEVVMRALATEPADRFPTAEAFAVGLAIAATDALGAGWLAASGMRATLGGRIAAITEGGGPSVPRWTGPVMRPAVAGTTATDTRPSPRGDASPMDPTVVSGAATPSAAPREPVDDPDAVLRARLDSAALSLRDDERAAAVRLLGGNGTAVTDRLDLPADASVTQIRAAALAEVERWRRRAEHPMSPRSVVTTAQELVRTCERLLPPSA
jgi:hypothetical protein